MTLATHSETGESLVVYQALYGDFKVYARPLKIFLSEVDKKKYPDAKQKYRFEKTLKSAGFSIRSEKTKSDAADDTVRQEPSNESESEVVKEVKNEGTFGANETSKNELQSRASGEVSGGNLIISENSVKPSKENVIPNNDTETDRKNDNFVKNENVSPAGKSSGLHPLLEEFLDTRKAGERLRILSALHRDITDQMIDTMALAMDTEIPEKGDLEDRYNELKYCLKMRERYEKSK